MEILIGFAQLWLLSGCIGLVIISVAALIEVWGMPLDDNGITNPFELFLLAVGILLSPMTGPIILLAGIEKLVDVIHKRRSMKDD